MREIGRIIVFVGYSDEIGRLDPIFEPGNFGVIVGYDGDAVKCLLSDESGTPTWWRCDLLFSEEFIPLGYAPLVPLKRLPLPYGTMIGEPH
jgi:hypothetical protein